jgi:hypothetical protein
LPVVDYLTTLLLGSIRGVTAWVAECRGQRTRTLTRVPSNSSVTRPRERRKGGGGVAGRLRLRQLLGDLLVWVGCDVLWGLMEMEMGKRSMICGLVIERASDSWQGLMVHSSLRTPAASMLLTRNGIQIGSVRASESGLTRIREMRCDANTAYLSGRSLLTAHYVVTSH